MTRERKSVACKTFFSNRGYSKEVLQQALNVEISGLHQFFTI